VIELAGSAAHVIVESLASPELSDDDVHHLSRVLRLRAGERVSATDGRGSWRWCEWNGGALETVGETRHVPAPMAEIGVAFALVKGDRVEWIVQKLTEIGVDRIVPMTTLRCVVRWDERQAATHLERLRRVARSAAMQSRRVWLPAVEPVRTLGEVLARPGAAPADLDGTWLSATSRLEVSLVVVGPEGGWDATEREGFINPVLLSEQVLRSETAAICAATVLQERRRSADNESPAPHVE
jgi:16S rRNA (uracil1498-N3)-methyltransferase